MNTYYGIKKNMTQVWDKAGRRYAATSVSVQPLVITQLKTKEKDGYQAIQVGFGRRPLKNTTKPLAYHLKKNTSKTSAPRYLKEISFDDDGKYKSGDTINITDIFTPGDIINVSGVSKGKGFTGVVKRWGFKGGPRTHGQSDRLRAPGSIGQGTDPGRVHKGKKMAGRHGNQRFTIKNSMVLHIDPQTSSILVSGPIPGPFNAIVQLTKVRSATQPFNLTGFGQNKSDKPASKTTPDEPQQQGAPVPANTDQSENKADDQPDKSKK